MRQISATVANLRRKWLHVAGIFMLSRIAVFCCALLLVLSEIAFAKSPNARPAPRYPTLWDYNGSVVYLIAKGSSREFYYKELRPGMLDAGVRPGSLLFRGQATNRQYFGTAFFYRFCGRFPYNVSGPILNGRIVLTGRAP